MQFTNDELKEMLKLHLMWLTGEVGGKQINLENANLENANLYNANLENAYLYNANLYNAYLEDANLKNAYLENAKNLVKLVGVEVGNFYWKRINKDFESNDYYFTVGINNLRGGEIFADDERVLCSYPGFHFASRSWCNLKYSDRLYEVKIQIPKGAKINEPWATDGKASANKIKIVQVIDSKTGKDVTEKFKNYADGKGNKITKK